MDAGRRPGSLGHTSLASSHGHVQFASCPPPIVFYYLNVSRDRGRVCVYMCLLFSIVVEVVSVYVSDLCVFCVCVFLMRLRVPVVSELISASWFPRQSGCNADDVMA